MDEDLLVLFEPAVQCVPLEADAVLRDAVVVHPGLAGAGGMHPSDPVLELLGLAGVAQHSVDHVGEREVVLRVGRELPQVDRVHRVEYDPVAEHRADAAGDRRGTAGRNQGFGVLAH
jgi:hypothetical protein